MDNKIDTYPEEPAGAQLLSIPSSVPELEHAGDRTEVFTWVQCSPNDYVKSDAKLYDGDRIQDAYNPFLLCRYRVGSVVGRVRDCI